MILAGHITAVTITTTDVIHDLYAIDSTFSLIKVRKMRWAEVLENRSLRDLPFKIETNRFGQIVMSPANRSHSRYQGIIVGLLYSMKKSGEVYPECPIETPEGVKVPDVAWASDELLSTVRREELTFSVPPELCVEVLSPSNSVLEIDEKKSLYFQQGAEEVWICDETGKLGFFTDAGKIEHSVLFPEFPKQI